MTSDDEQAKPPEADEVAEAYSDYRRTMTRYHKVLGRYITAHPNEVDPLFVAFAQDTALLRVLHALSVSYGWSDEIYKVSTRAQVAHAQLRGFVTRDDPHGGLVLTQAGVETLRRWTEHVVPLADKHPRYRELWRAVTGLEG